MREITLARLPVSAAILSRSVASFMILGTVLPGVSSSAFGFYGYSSNHGPIVQALGSFDAEVDLFSESEPTQEQIRDAVEFQRVMIISTLGNSDSFDSDAGLSSNFDLSDVQAERKPGSTDRWIVSYRFSDEFYVNEGVRRIRINWPIRPDALFEKMVVLAGGKYINQCTWESDWNTPATIWVTWSPKKPGCPLVEGEDYKVISVDLEEPLPNTARTYPEYERLLNEEGEIIFNFLDGQIGLAPPYPSNDKRSWTNDEIKENLGLTDLPGVYGTPRVDEYRWKAKRGTLIYRSFTGFNPYHPATQYAFNAALAFGLRDSAVFGYTGHGGRGLTSTLKEIEESTGMKFQLRSGYQIIEWTACYADSFYANQFWDYKKSSLDPLGTKDLDVLTNNLSITMGFSGVRDRLFAGLLDWLQGRGGTSYQELLNQGQVHSVFGDEDNPSSIP
jgi:hypothetical protein